MKKETIIFKNTVKQRIPVAKPGFAFKTKKEQKRTKITLDNWDK